MEQNLVSDEELIERINKVLNESKVDEKKVFTEVRREDSYKNFIEASAQDHIEGDFAKSKRGSEQKNLELENHFLSLQLEAEKKKSKELQSKFKLFENSVKYFERLNGQLENIKKAVNEGADKGDMVKYNLEQMQKIRPKTIHTAPSGVMTNSNADELTNDAVNFGEPNNEDSEAKQRIKKDKEEIVFRDAEDFKQLEQGLEIVKQEDLDLEAEKVFITKTEKKCLEDIGNIASHTRTPIDDKHQRYFERDRRKFANSIVMPEIQEVDKTDVVPPEIISKTKETPVNISSTEFGGLRTYLLQLKEVIARRETAWARATERDYNQRVEITRFKNEVSHLRMLCEKRQKDIKERDQIIAAKDDEIRELQKRIQSLKKAILKLEKKDERLMDKIDGITNEVLENSHLVQRSYNAMKRQSLMNRGNAASTVNVAQKLTSTSTSKPSSRNKDGTAKKLKTPVDKTAKIKGSETSNEDERSHGDSKSKVSVKEKAKMRHRSESMVHKSKDTYDKVDEKLQRVEEMLHNEVLRGVRKASHNRNSKSDIKTLIAQQNRSITADRTHNDFAFVKKLTPSNSTIRQEMLTAMTGLSSNPNKASSYFYSKKSHPGASVIANALLAARNVNLYNY